ncbi:MAG: hypothetical protein LLF80_04785 [Porphyromonadaceae bacterium]|nr:hypothetical protein [Porphyromonadaceae bacterium]
MILKTKSLLPGSFKGNGKMLKRGISPWVRNCFFAFVFLFFITESFSQQLKTLVPIYMDWDDSQKTVFDFSGYLTAPAGKDGYIRTKGEHFYKPDGSRFRSWGVDLKAEFFFMPKEKAEKVAADFARCGFTCVRFHSLDAWQQGFLFSNPQNTLEWDAEKLDQFDYFVAQLKKHGIYFTFTLNAYRIFRSGDGIVDYDKIGFGKPTYYFDEKIQERCIEFSRKFLTHKNPYTGTEYRNEPALAWIELLNENSLIEAWLFGRVAGDDNSTAREAWRPLTTYYAKELQVIWNAWLEKNVSLIQRKQWATTFNAPAGDIPLSTPANRAQCSDDHYLAEVHFLMEMEENYFKKMEAFLRNEIGTKTMIIGDAHHNTGTSPYPHTLAFNGHGNFINSHGYWIIPQWGSPTIIRSAPMVNDPLNSIIPHFARTPMKGKPFTISETNSPFPQRYAGEYAPILVAYSLFHDWDGIIWFEWGKGQLSSFTGQHGGHSQGTDPVRFANLIITGQIFLRQDIEPARQNIVRTVSRKEALESLRWSRDERPFFTRGFSKSTAMQHKTQWQLAEDGQAVQQTFPSAAPLGLIRSDTEQLIWKNADQDKGVVSINAPLTQGCVGFIGGSTELLDDIDIMVENEHATVLMTSLDGKPIHTAERLLLVTHSYYESTGLEFGDDKQTIKSFGTYPLRILPVTGEIRFKNTGGARKVTVTPLTGIGTLTEKSFNAISNRTDWTIPLKKENTSTWYLIEVTR